MLQSDAKFFIKTVPRERFIYFRSDILATLKSRTNSDKSSEQ